MNENQQIRFVEIDDDVSFFEKMATAMEANGQTLMLVKRITKRYATRISKEEQFQQSEDDIIDTDEEPKLVYPKKTSPKGTEKINKLKGLAKYVGANIEEESDTHELILHDENTNESYRPEVSYIKLKGKASARSENSFEYYKAFLLHDVTKYINREKMLLQDTTTGVPSRKQLMPMLIDYISQAITKKESFALTMLDIDSFKNINDTYGHQYGDSVLRVLAQYVSRSIHYGNNDKNNIISRYGGEEFVFTLNNIDFDVAQKKNEEIRSGIAFALQEYRNISIKLTCSLGMVFVDHEQIKDIKPSDLDKIEELARQIIKEADKKMYVSKNDGKNKLTVVEYSSELDIERK